MVIKTVRKMLDLTHADEIAIERDLCTDLAEFVKSAWPIIDPAMPYSHNWHVDAVCEHLEAAFRGEILRLLINIPPGCSKSSLTGVYFPAWIWGPMRKQSFRFIGASHEQSLAIRDNRRTRLLIESDWFQERWPVTITSDQNEKGMFENDRFGFRTANAVKSLTGKRGDCVLWDDPLSPEKAYSDRDRDTANRVFDETLPLRVVDPKKSMIIVIMQRLHEQDVSGHILEKDLGYEHLMLPMEYEPERQCKTSIGFKDPRTKKGELLDKKRFPSWVIDRDKKALGSFATAGQLQQRPVPRGGGLFKRSDFEIVDAAPAIVADRVRAWDLASTEVEGAARTAGLRMSVTNDGVYYIEHVVADNLNSGRAHNLILGTAAVDGKTVRGSIPQDPGQAGKAQVQFLIKSLAGYSYRASPESGDKITRAMPVAAQVEAGNVKVVKGDWNEAFLDEVSSFPNRDQKDQVDAMTRAFSELILSRPTALYGTYG